MDAEASSREETPEHSPTHGVYLSDREIESILWYCFDGISDNYTCTSLAHVKSYSNRIYFIDDTREPNKSYVLKVNGSSFGIPKTENEVSCLRILQRFCGPLPTPSVVAWSTDGSNATVREYNFTPPRETTVDLCIPNQRSWILMTRLPGEPIETSTLTPLDALRLSCQLAELMKIWRSVVPKSKHSGNLRFRDEEDAPVTPLWHWGSKVCDLEVDIQGILDLGWSETRRPIDSLLEYWKGLLIGAIYRLQTREVYAPNRNKLVLLVHDFIHDDLEKLSIFRESREAEDGFIFTHMALSPRNVLVSGSPPYISGIVDFETSGFFPLLREYSGMSVVSEEEHEEGWPNEMHEQILLALDHEGQVTPLQSKDGSEKPGQWMALTNLVTYIAPRWFETGSVGLEDELKEASEIVEAALLSLKKSIPSSGRRKTRNT